MVAPGYPKALSENETIYAGTIGMYVDFEHKVTTLATSVKVDASWTLREALQLRDLEFTVDLPTAIESYAVDNNKYPPDIENGWPWYITRVLSTPIAYITSTVLYDPFRKHLLARGSTYWGRYRFVNYRANIEGWGGLGPNYPGWRPASPSPSDPMWQEGMLKYGAWKLNSAGPDKTASYNPPFGFITDEIIYDPTNGTVSRGDIVRSQRESNVLTGG